MSDVAISQHFRRDPRFNLEIHLGTQAQLNVLTELRKGTWLPPVSLLSLACHIVKDGLGLRKLPL